VAVIIRPERLTVSLSWAGRVLDGPLTRPIRAPDAVWTLGDAAPARLPPPPPLRPGAGAAESAAAAGGGGGGKGQREQARPRLPEGCVALSLVLPKAEEGRFWKSLFEGGAEKSHWEVGRHLSKAVRVNHRCRRPRRPTPVVKGRAGQPPLRFLHKLFSALAPPALQVHACSSPLREPASPAAGCVGIPGLHSNCRVFASYAPFPAICTPPAPVRGGAQRGRRALGSLCGCDGPRSGPTAGEPDRAPAHGAASRAGRPADPASA
jgi:hypothetical protein